MAEPKIDRETLYISLAMYERDIAQNTRDLATATAKGSSCDLAPAYHHLGEQIVRAEITRRAIHALNALGRLAIVGRALTKGDTPNRERFEAWVLEVARVYRGLDALKRLGVEHAEEIEGDIQALFGDGKWMQPVLGTSTRSETQEEFSRIVLGMVESLAYRLAEPVEIPAHILAHLDQSKD